MDGPSIADRASCGTFIRNNRMFRYADSGAKKVELANRSSKFA